MTTLPFKVALALVIAAICAALFGAGYVVRGYKADAEIAELRAEYEREKQERTKAHAKALKDAIDLERAVNTKLQEARDAETRQREAADLARRKSDAVAVRLRDELQATRADLANLSRDPATSPACKAAAEAGAMCAHLLGRCSERRRELADFAESSARAGDLCVRSYEALTPDAQTGPPGP